jgi:hypothetical protein
MRILIRAGNAPAILLAAITVALLSVAGSAGWAGEARAASEAQAGRGICYPVNLTWICVYTGNQDGSQGTDGESPTLTCTYSKAPARVLKAAGTGAPAPGYQWDILTCPGAEPGSLGDELVQVNKRTGAPAISPFAMFRIGIGVLRVPTLAAATAPPRGKDGLVGLPEWYWVPRGQWHAVSVTVNAGPVWAKAVASPTRLSYVPGGDMNSVSCAGPGMPFNRSLPTERQRTDCAYSYAEPSLGQPGNAYQAGVFVTWTVRWTGSGGAGGVITDRYTTGTAFGVRIAQAEALVTTP